MNEMWPPALALVAGLLVGTMFFGGLWWTVRKGVSSKQPVRWFLGSLLLRMTIALAGFYVVSGRRWERLLLCLGGFIIARVVVAWRIRPARENDVHAVPEAGHAPEPR